MSNLIDDYLKIKKSYPEHILFYRLGEFYELFFEDAKIVAEKLSITLNQKNLSHSIVPSCGIPAKSLINNSNKLLRLGLKIAIAEQFVDEEKSTEKNPKFIRKVTKILTPATVIEEDYLLNENNILLAIHKNNSEDFDLCWGDVLLGEFYVDNIAIDQLESYLQLISPQEILIEKNSKSSLDKFNYCISIYQPSPQKNIQNSLKIISKNNNLALQLIIDYISQIHGTGMISNLQISNYQDDQFLKLDQNTITNLELISSKTRDRSSLMAIMDKTKTAMGKRLLRKTILRPLRNIHKINQRLEAVAFLLDEKQLQETIFLQLQTLPDLEKIIFRFDLNKKINAKNLLFLCESLQTLASIAQLFFIHNNQKTLPNKLKTISAELICDFNLINKLDSALDREKIRADDPGFFIKENFDAKMDDLQNKKLLFYNQIRRLEINYQKQIGIKNLKIEYNNILGYFIEVKSGLSSKFNGFDDFEIRQNLTNHVRYSTAELRKYELEINNLTTKILAYEMEILERLSVKLILKLDHIKASAKLIAELDLIISFAIIAKENNYCLPQFLDSNYLEIIGGRNPIIEKFKTGFIANDCYLNQQKRVWLISGANMAGKSTFLRQNALIAIMAHTGSFVPANQAKIGVLKQIFTRIGSDDNLSKNQSSFMSEMIGIAEILNEADKNSLIILDEIGNSTTSEHGIALAYAIINYLHNSNFSLALISTHHLKLCKLLDHMENLTNYQMTISRKNNDVEFNYNIEAGIAKSSFAIDIAKLTKLPHQVIHIAEKLLANEKLDKLHKGQ